MGAFLYHVLLRVLFDNQSASDSTSDLKSSESPDFVSRPVTWSWGFRWPSWSFNPKDAVWGVVYKQIWIMNLLMYDLCQDQSYSRKQVKCNAYFLTEARSHFFVQKPANVIECSIYIYIRITNIHIYVPYIVYAGSPSRPNFCPLVGSGILNSWIIWIILKTILCLVLDFQGIYIYIHTLDILYDTCIFVYILYYALFNTIILSSLFQSHHLISHPKKKNNCHNPSPSSTLPCEQVR